MDDETIDTRLGGRKAAAEEAKQALSHCLEVPSASMRAAEAGDVVARLLEASATDTLAILLDCLGFRTFAAFREAVLGGHGRAPMGVYPTKKTRRTVEHLVAAHGIGAVLRHLDLDEPTLDRVLEPGSRVSRAALARLEARLARPVTRRLDWKDDGTCYDAACDDGRPWRARYRHPETRRFVRVGRYATHHEAAARVIGIKEVTWSTR
jgi:hypothetical protein